MHMVFIDLHGEFGRHPNEQHRALSLGHHLADGQLGKFVQLDAAIQAVGAVDVDRAVAEIEERVHQDGLVHTSPRCTRPSTRRPSSWGRTGRSA